MAAEPRRPVELVLTDEGPLLVSGPVELVLTDGTRVSPRRPVIALCLCRRSRRFPYCDASHRVKRRPGDTGEPSC